MAIIYASPKGGVVQFEGNAIKSFALSVAVHRATPGDVVQLVPGKYEHPVLVTDGGTAEAPVIIRGGENVSLDGNQNPTKANGRFEPSDEDFAFIKVYTTEHIELEGLAFRNCWPCAIYFRGCRHITIRDCEIVGSRFVVYARNKHAGFLSQGIKTRDVSLVRLRWIQDPEALMWRGEVSWDDVKGRTDNDYSYFNGALFGSWDIRGWIAIRKCHVSHAFNAIRMDCKSDLELKRGRNMNVVVKDCHFEYIRDNVIEPENVALNWWIYRNTIFNAHAPFSLHGLSGGWIYIFANRTWFNSKPGIAGQGHRNGQHFKMPHSSQKPLPQYPLYVFNNSTFLRSVYAKKGETRNLHHANNVIEFCFNGAYCKSRRSFFGTEGKRFRWHPSYDFQNDVSNHPEFPDGFPSECGYQLSGVRLSQAFVDPREGDLSPVDSGELLGSAVRMELKMPDNSTQPTSGGGNIGALQGDGVLFEGPAFVELGWPFSPM